MLTEIHSDGKKIWLQVTISDSNIEIFCRRIRLKQNVTNMALQYSKMYIYR